MMSGEPGARAARGCAPVGPAATEAGFRAGRPRRGAPPLVPGGTTKGARRVFVRCLLAGAARSPSTCTTATRSPLPARRHHASRRRPRGGGPPARSRPDPGAAPHPLRGLEDPPRAAVRARGSRGEMPDALRQGARQGPALSVVHEGTGAGVAPIMWMRMSDPRAAPAPPREPASSCFFTARSPAAGSGRSPDRSRPGQGESPPRRRTPRPARRGVPRRAGRTRAAHRSAKCEGKRDCGVEVPHEGVPEVRRIGRRRLRRARVLGKLKSLAHKRQTAYTPGESRCQAQAVRGRLPPEKAITLVRHGAPP